VQAFHGTFRRAVKGILDSGLSGADCRRVGSVPVAAFCGICGWQTADAGLTSPAVELESLVDKAVSCVDRGPVAGRLGRGV
jgi:hypothetical protein